MSEGRRLPARFPSTLSATLSAILLGGACTGGDRGSGEGAWEFRADSAPLLRTVGKEGPQGEPQKNAVIFSFDCLPDRAVSTLMTEQALRQGSVEVELRLDGEPPRRIPGFAGTTPTGGQLVLTIPQDSMLALLSGHQRATVQYADGAGSSRTTAVFPVAGLEQHREQFREACARRSGPRSAH